MKVTKYLDISQTVEVNISPEDITVILEEPWNNEDETKQKILCNLNTCVGYLKGVPPDAIKKLHVNVRRILVRNLKPILEKFQTLDCADHVMGQRCDCWECNAAGK